MKKAFYLCSLVLGLLTFLSITAISKGSEVSSLSSFYSLKAKDISGNQIDLSRFKGQVLLIVNTASRCGFTSQYGGLEELYKKYEPQKFSVLGFPSNDFMGQEPGSDEEVKQFCTTQFGVSFPLFSKAPVTGSEKQPVYRFLTELGGDQYTGEVKWNFEKFLLDRKGNVRARFNSFTSPGSSRLVNKIEELLKESEI